MKKSRLSESQIVGILKESEGVITPAQILQTHGISQGTFYKWRSEYGGLQASELKCIKDLEQQLSEYKTMITKLMRDNRALKSLIKKALAPTSKLEVVDCLAG